MAVFLLSISRKLCRTIMDIKKSYHDIALKTNNYSKSRKRIQLIDFFFLAQLDFMLNRFKMRFETFYLLVMVLYKR